MEASNCEMTRVATYRTTICQGSLPLGIVVEELNAHLNSERNTCYAGDAEVLGVLSATVEREDSPLIISLQC